MITIELMDDFFTDNEEIMKKIKTISQNYSLEDFVKVSEKVRDYLIDNKETQIGTIHGCIYCMAFAKMMMFFIRLELLL